MMKQLGPLIIDIAGITLTERDIDLLQHPLVGGVILFARNYESPAQLKSLTNAILENCGDKKRQQQFIISVDQEGGRVQRFLNGFTPIPSMQAISHKVELGKITRSDVSNIARLLCHELLLHGVNVTYAPVLDVQDGGHEVIGSRAFGSDEETVVTLASAWINGMKQAGFPAIGKHYPGHGRVKADSHIDLPKDPRTLDSLKSSCMKPFTALADQLDGIMPAHIIFPEIDSDNPASLSEYFLQDLLRKSLGFGGFVVTDDLNMAGARSFGTPAEMTDRALRAGADYILLCNARDDVESTIQTLSANTISNTRKPWPVRDLTGELTSILTDDEATSIRHQIQAIF